MERHQVVHCSTIRQNVNQIATYIGRAAVSAPTFDRPRFCKGDPPGRPYQETTVPEDALAEESLDIGNCESYNYGQTEEDERDDTALQII
jgi:hypothetical protein